MEQEGWEYKDFVTFLELAGVKAVKLIGKGKCESFKCVTAQNEERELVIESGGFYDGPSTIWITEEGNTKKYAINKNFKNVMPKLTLYGTTLIREKQLDSYYNYYHTGENYASTVTWEDNVFEIIIDEPPKLNYSKIEEYMMNLNSSLKIYDTLRGILSEDEISNCKNVELTYAKNKRIMSKIRVKEKKIQEYREHDGGKLLDIFRNGDWEYNEYNDDDDEIKIRYSAKNKKYTISIEEAEDMINTVNLLNKLKIKVAKMYHIFIK